MFTRGCGISDFSVSSGVLHAPKPGALPTGPHPDIYLLIPYCYALSLSRLVFQTGRPSCCNIGSVCTSFANRRVAATPFSSLSPPPAALGNVPNRDTPGYIVGTLPYRQRTHYNRFLPFVQGEISQPVQPSEHPRGRSFPMPRPDPRGPCGRKQPACGK